MVETLKISEMTDGGDFELNQIAPVLESGANRKVSVQLQFAATGDTAERPAIPANPTIRYNTDFEQFEYWDGTIWTQLSSSGSVAALIARLAAHTAGDGASMIGLENQGSVSNKTVQDMSEADFIVKTTTGSLLNGFALSSLSTGFMSVTTGTGALISRSMTGSTDQITVTNGSGLAGNPQISIAANPQFSGSSNARLPLGSTAQRPITPLNGMIRYNTTDNVLEYYNSNLAAWEQVVPSTGVVASVSGTLNRITSSGGLNPVIDIAATYVGQTSITTLGTINTGIWNGTIVDSTFGGTGINNGGSTITVGGNFAMIGVHTFAGTLTGDTSVTFPTSGTLLTSASAVSSITGTANQISASASVGAVTLSLSNNPVLPGTAGVTLPQGNTAAQAGNAGTIRFNTQTTVFEGTTDGLAWSPFSMASGTVVSVSGTANRITSTGGTTPVIDISASYIGQSSITTLGTISSGTWNGTVISPTYGGTGINNGTSTITIGGNIAFSGAHTFTGVLTGNTNVTFPTSGTLSTTTGTVTSVSGTTNRITSTGGNAPVIDIDAGYVGQASITTLGTIVTGTWHGSVIGSTYGGTGINNGSSTITVGGNIAFSGAHTFTGTLTADTSVTFPTSGTLITSASVPIVDAWVQYTPTFTGFGTVTTSNIWSRRVGGNLEVRGTFTTGTTTGTEARISMGYNGVDGAVTSSSTVITAIQLAGDLAQAGGTASTFYCLIEASKTYLTISQQGAVTNALTKINGSQFNSTSSISINTTIPISGWS